MADTIKDLVGKKMSKKVRFMDKDVQISKLSVSEVMKIQEQAKSLSGNDDSMGLEVLQIVITSSVEGASELTAEDFKSFPMDELSKLSNEIMKYSGIGTEAGK